MSWGKPAKGAKQKGKGKGKGSGIPKELEGMDLMKDGKRICFAYNLEGCGYGKDCKRGLHVCMRTGCGKEHSQRDHDKMK